MYLDEPKKDFWVLTFKTWIKDNIINAQLIFDKGSPVDCIDYGKSRDKSMPNWGEIVSIYLLPQYFDKGYGNRLLKKALLDLKQDGYLGTYLWVLKENQQARHFYEKNNFKCTEDEYSCKIMNKQLTDIRYIYSFNDSLE